MSEVFTGLLKLTFGLVSNKLRTYGAEKLQDGGLADQKFRGLIVRELDDIKSKLDAISRKDLSASISCLQQVEVKPAQQSVTVEDAVALANAIGKLKIVSIERYELAKESFKEAGKEARRAFHNAALSTEERILASKVRIASGILEHLDDLELAVSDCLHCLQELNDMRATQEIFSVHVKGGVKSVFKKDSRAEIVESVTMINWILADFISKFTKQRMAVFDWPMIKCGKRIVHPIHCKKESVPNLKEMKITPPWDIVVFETSLDDEKCVLNKRGDFICADGRRLLKLDKTTGKLQPYCISPLDDNTEQSQPNSKVVDVTIDEDDQVYVLSRDEAFDFTLSIYSADGRNTHHCSLEFLKGQDYLIMYINVTKDKNIVISCMFESIMVYLYNSKGELINSFDTDLKDRILRSVSVSCNNEITLTTQTNNDFLKDSNVLYIYTENGQLQRTAKFRPIEGDDTYDMLFYNQVAKKFIGEVYDEDDNKTLIEYLSDQTAERECSYLLYDTNFPERTVCFEIVRYSTNDALCWVSVISLLYSVLLRDGLKVPSKIPEQLSDEMDAMATKGLRFLNFLATADLTLVQNSLGCEGVSLQFRHIVGHTLRICSPEKNYELLHEVILIIGYFTVLNPDNQVFVQSGRPPTLLQKLCSLPFQYFSNPRLRNILFPTLICSCYQNEQNKDILEQEVSCALLNNYLEDQSLDFQQEKLGNANSSQPILDEMSRRILLPRRFPVKHWKEAQEFLQCPKR
ncbi:Hypothetical predicted protein [Paramuricea clavata]|uniref:Uncharacterized protein n=1 Tax=Paramuricea clavata TaxID=317549 RepID=A0A7D9HQ84_PARCT|nr:Hypothetical predicted protein [Paramuricea clavata]